MKLPPAYPVPALRREEGGAAAGHWYAQVQPWYCDGNDVQLLCGGGQLFPAMCEAIAQARHEVWVATYIFHDDPAALTVLEALADAAQRGVRVRVVVDGFGAKSGLETVSRRLGEAGAGFTVFRPMTGWRSWLQPEHLRRLHQKLCAVDGEQGFVGGINLIDDRVDLTHGELDAPRLDYAVRVRGPVVGPIEQTVRAMWTRAVIGRDWTEQIVAMARSPRPAQRVRHLLSQARLPRPPALAAAPVEAPAPMRAAFVVRDNLRQRRTIERSYIEAIRNARERVDLVSPYFYPGQAFRRVLRQAASRGVRVRLLMQGRWDYQVAAMAARAVYGDLRAHGVRIFEYTPAFLHAKVALVDQDWATVGSSNIDPLSLLLNLEANVIVRDAGFVATLERELDLAFAAATEVGGAPPVGTWAGLRQHLVAIGARLYMRLAGERKRY